MPRYDYGLRGPWPMDLTRRDYPDEFAAGTQRPSPTRVTTRYNADYGQPTDGERYPRNPNPYGGDWYGRMVDERGYRHAYITRAGTWTSRGAPIPRGSRYDDPFTGGPPGARFPDDL